MSKALRGWSLFRSIPSHAQPYPCQAPPNRAVPHLASPRLVQTKCSSVGEIEEQI